MQIGCSKKYKNASQNVFSRHKSGQFAFTLRAYFHAIGVVIVSTPSSKFNESGKPVLGGSPNPLCRFYLPHQCPNHTAY